MGLQDTTYMAGLVREVWWQDLRTYRNDPTCALVRKVKTGGNKIIGIDPVVTVVPGYGFLPVAVLEPGDYVPGRTQVDQIQIQQGERYFCFRDLPAHAPWEFARIYPLDEVVFEGKTWRPKDGTSIWNDPVTFLSSALFAEMTP